MEAPVQPGDTLLGKYRVEHILGQGGMGVVVAARHLELEELFAIKFLLPQALDSDQSVERFLREARAAARLKGEHVAKVHDVGRLETGAPYMVMEHLDGMDLQQVVRSRGPLPIEEAVLYVLQACNAVAEAHARGIVHRDIKPSNLFLTQRHDGTPCVKVLDFGISKLRTEGSLDLTVTGMMLGSPMYMSPEQMTRIKETDLRSDVWSMGVVLYYLLTGRAPFPAGALTELVRKILQVEPTRPSVLRPDLPSALDAIILRCLEKRPEKRFQTMGELAAALRALPPPLEAAMERVESPLETPTPAAVNTATSFGRTSATARSRSKAIIITSVIAVLTVAGGGVAWLGLRGQETKASVSGHAPTATLADEPAHAPDLRCLEVLSWSCQQACPSFLGEHQRRPFQCSTSYPGRQPASTSKRPETGWRGSPPSLTGVMSVTAMR